MSTPMDHIAYLSQEIGPRPSGTEEEQQAALYITDRLQKDARLSASIEDFACSTDAGMPRLVCYIVLVLSAVLSIALPVVSIPAAILSFIAASILILEALDKPVVSRFLMKGISQNVVGKYEPVRDPESAGARRRKVILVANYDSGKVRRDLARPLVAVRRILDIAVLAASVLIPLVVLVKQLAFGSAEGALDITFIVIKAILAVIVLIPLVFAVMEKIAPFNEGANSNAAGVAVMLEVARRLGTGEVGSSPIVSEGIMHDENAARAAGVVPDGASIHYAHDSSDDAHIAAKAAAAGFAAHGAVHDIASNLVQVKDAPLAAPDEEALSKIRQDTRAALASAPAGTLAEAAAKAAALHEQAEARAAEEAAAQERAAKEAEMAAAALEAKKAEEERIKAEAEKPAGVPDWYRKATEKARIKAEQASTSDDASSYRSRYADFPKESEAASEPDSEIQPAVSEDVSDETVAVKPQGDSAKDMPAAESGEISSESVVVATVQDFGATTEMAPLDQGGNLDLDAMRNAAQKTDSADSSDSTQSESAAAQAAEAISGAATTRLPQMMYYTPPVDRSDVMRDRAQKDRVTISSDELSQAATLDAAQGDSSSVGSAPAVPMSMHAVVPSVLPQVENQQASAPEPRVISANIPVADLPPIALPPISAPELKPVSFEEFRQRAPLANVADSHGQDAAKSLLATTLPPIDPVDSDATVGMPAVHQEKPQNVSLTGSFAAIEAVGAKPVGDELLEGVDPEDIYVDDADDSSFEAEFTETGAFAGPGYVEMPQSRVGKFFGRFRRKKKSEEESAHEWLGVDEDFDARSVGKARGGWESFRDEEDDWQGGAFGNLRARMGRGADSADEVADASQDGDAAHGAARRRSAVSDGVSADAFAAVAAMAASKSGGDEDVAPVPHADFDGVQQIYSFAAGDINTEVWFVALGSELGGQGGIKAFLADHASDMRGAIIINLESLGSGELCYLEREGALRQMACSPRMKRFIRKAMQVSGVDMRGVTVNWRESPASYAMKHRAQAVTIAGMDGSKPALMGEADDVIENVDEESLNRAADFIVELLKNI